MMRCRDCRPIVCMAAILALANAASSQTRPAEEPAAAPGINNAIDETVVVNQAPKYRPFVLEDYKASLELLARLQSDKSSSSGADNRVRQNEFRELLNLSGSAFVLHPNIVQLLMSGSFGLEQTLLDDNNTSTSDLGFINEYDFNALFLRKEMAPLTFFSRRSNTIINREFGGSIESIAMTNGISADIRSRILPTQIQFYHQTEEQTDPLGASNLDRNMYAFQGHTEYRPTPQHIFGLNYAYSNIQQNSQSLAGSSFDTHDATLSHSWTFGERNRNNLSSSLSLFNQTGDFAIQRFRWDESLFLHHSDTFQTNYQYAYSQDRTDTSDQSTHRAAAGFRHQLFASLTTSGNVGAILQDYSGSTSQEYFVNLGTEYRKHVPYGVFTANLDLNFDYQNNQQRINPISIVNEPHTFIDPIPIALTRRGVNASSLVVTNSGNTTLYTPGVDYLVTAFPDRVEVSRMLGGAIGPGDTVLMDYIIDAQPANDITTLTPAIGTRYEIREGWLKGLSPYARYLRQSQSISSNDPDAFEPDSISDWMAGADYHVWHLTFNAEYQRHDSTRYPFNAAKMSARYDYAPSRATLLGLSASHQIIEYPQDNNSADFTMVSLRAQHKITNSLYGGASLIWRMDQNRLQGDSQGLDQQLELRWQRRKLEMYILFRNTFLDASTQRNDTQVLTVGIRREF